jgi:phosphohistidine phosphatase
MKTVYLIRHAKSSWDDNKLSDHDRPLNKRGEKDAPAMAAFLRKEGGKPDLLISSTAKRAKHTAQAFAKEFGRKKSEIELHAELYHAAPGEITKLLRKLSNDHDSAAIFAHNPGLTILANAFLGKHLDNVPTTGIVGVRCPVDRWKDWNPTEAERFLFIYPKMLK